MSSHTIGSSKSIGFANNVLLYIYVY